MEDYEEELHGVEDDFHSQFAAELEVLAELEGGCGPLDPRRESERAEEVMPNLNQGRAGTQRLSNAADGAQLLSRASAVDCFRCRNAISAHLRASAAGCGRALANVRGGHRWRGRRHSSLSPWLFRQQQTRC